MRRWRGLAAVVACAGAAALIVPRCGASLEPSEPREADDIAHRSGGAPRRAATQMAPELRRAVWAVPATTTLTLARGATVTLVAAPR